MTRRSKIKISDWLEYLQQISSSNMNYFIAFFSMIGVFLTLIIAIVFNATSGIEGKAVIGYEVPEEGIIVVELVKLHGEISSIYLAIAGFFLTYLVIVIIYFFHHKDVLRAKCAKRLIECIFSKKYKNFKDVDNIEEKWTKLNQKISNTSFQERFHLLSKKEIKKRYFSDWFFKS